MENQAPGTPTADVGYENTADEKWARQALDFYRRGELQVLAFDTDGVVSAQVWGTCPRCGHEMNVQMTLSAPLIGLRTGRGLWGALTRRDLPASSGIPDSVEAGCGCGQAHSGAPAELTGCGVSFRLPTAPADGTSTSR